MSICMIAFWIGRGVNRIREALRECYCKSFSPIILVRKQKVGEKIKLLRDVKLAKKYTERL